MRNRLFSSFGILLFLAFFLSIKQQQRLEKAVSDPPFYNEISTQWVDSVFNTLSPSQKIGQLFMVAAYSNKGSAHRQAISKLITQQHIGGLIFFQGSPGRQVTLLNQYQTLSKVPLLIAMDAEWGLGMRLDSTIRFPRQLMLGAIQDETLIRQMGREIARECRRVGVHVNFAPVVDVNVNPLNPVIGDRSFGENKYNVARKGRAYMQGLQEGNVLSCAKHFPGHGDTHQDSHKTLPKIAHSRNRLDSVELYPFKEMIGTGVGSIMTAHLYIPSLDKKKNQAASLSPKVVQELLKDSLKFKGLVFTDALNMKGVSDHFKSGELEVKALEAGNDVLLYPENIPLAISAIQEALKNGRLKQEVLDDRVKKILKAKYWAGLSKFELIKVDSLYYDLNLPTAQYLRRKLVEHALTLVLNAHQIIPLQLLDTLQIRTLSIGLSGESPFQKTLAKYAPMEHFQLQKNASKEDYKVLLEKLKGSDMIIVGIHAMSRSAKRDFGVSPQIREFLAALKKQSKVILSVFGSPYSLKFFKNYDGVVMAYESSVDAQELSAQLIFGGIQAKGKLPVTASPTYPAGHGLSSRGPIRLNYTYPEAVGIASEDLARIDSIALEAIAEGATPGCQVWVAKKGTVIYQKSFGHHTYKQRRRVQNTDIYDLASITKIAASTLSLMRLYDLNLLDVNKKLSDYLPDLDRTNKKNMVIREILSHQSGFKDWIPFYLHTLNEEGFVDSNYCTFPNKDFSIPVTADLYLQNEYPKVMYQEILDSRVKHRGKYRYSDLGYYLLKQIVEDLNVQALDEYVEDNFYAPLGLATMQFNPLNHFPLDRIIPTELDEGFRRTLIHGYVHDPGAAMLGGVGGHAGLFCNANDLGILMQMLLDNGRYGADQFFKPLTVGVFASKQFRKNRRGMGFDKPEPDPDEVGPTDIQASLQTFGHTGFTGTAAWADPKHDLVYIFLSNRIHPDMNNRKLVDMDIRTRIQGVIYDAIKKANGVPE